MPKAKYYAVLTGRRPGIYRTWEECKAQVDKFAMALFKSFKTEKEAIEYLATGKSLQGGEGDAGGGKRGRGTQEGCEGGALDFTDRREKVPKKQKCSPPSSPELPRDHQPLDQPQPASLDASDGVLGVPDGWKIGMPVSLVCHFDGGSRSNHLPKEQRTMPAGAGCVVKAYQSHPPPPSGSPPPVNPAVLHEASLPLPPGVTNNVAEYKGLEITLDALESILRDWPPSAPPVTSVDIYSDSKMVVKQVNGEWQSHDPTLKSMLVSSRSKLKNLRSLLDDLAGSTIPLAVRHVRRSLNKAADALANRAMDSGAREARTLTTSELFSA